MLYSDQTNAFTTNSPENFPPNLLYTLTKPPLWYSPPYLGRGRGRGFGGEAVGLFATPFNTLTPWGVRLKPR